MKLKFFVLLVLNAAGASAQNVDLETVCTFPIDLSETSGLVKLDSARVLTHNDSGDSSRIFVYNYQTCTLEKQVMIRDHEATDFEAITMDDSGYVYVADMGNNLGNRTNLCILKLKASEILALDTVDAQKIFFGYADQVSFSSSAHNFDAEAMVHYRDTLFVFSKNHGVTGNYCKRYALPDVPGTYMVSPLDSMAFPSWVTDATIDATHEHFVLVSEQKMYAFSMPTGLVAFDHPPTTLSFTFLSQKEGLCFINADTVLVSDESAFGMGPNLYLADLSGYLGIKTPVSTLELAVFHDQDELSFTNPFPGTLQYEIIGINGVGIQKGEVMPGHFLRYFLQQQKGILLLRYEEKFKTVKF